MAIRIGTVGELKAELEKFEDAQELEFELDSKRFTFYYSGADEDTGYAIIGIDTK